jgi:two-component system phosphate regulon response regulator PhoB
MSSHVLIVEDDRDLQRLLTYNFEQAGFHVVAALDGETALRAVTQRRFDLVLLDLTLPDMPGTEVCRLLKQLPQTAAIPVVIVTAKGEEMDRVVGFKMGAADYVVKPFSVRELILRVQAILRRTQRTVERHELFSFGKLEVDRAAHRAWVQGEEVVLTPLEMRLLVVFYENLGRVLTRDTLHDEVWGSDLDLTVRNVDTQVKRLRERLRRAGEYIETVRGVGYRFRVEPADESPSVPRDSCQPQR